MHKFMLKLFGFLKSSVQFLKVFIMFIALCLILYWIDYLVGFQWSWLNFIKPVLNFFLSIASLISDESVDVLGTVFENKFGIAFILILLFYFVANYLQKGVVILEELYDDGRRCVKKMQEDAYNKSLEKQNISEQEQIKKYQIYISAHKKDKIPKHQAGFDLEEEIKNMNKFLMQNLGTNPVKYGEGFLYTFNDFSHIDQVLSYFFKIIKSSTCLDYLVCVQILPRNLKDEFEKMRKLIGLKLFNKITTLADTAWRYKYNETQKYNTVQLGLYRKEKEAFEVLEFAEM